MVKISPLISESLSEYLILTGEVEVPPEKVSLKTKLGRIHFQYPYMTARMQSVVGPEMAVAAGRNGILPIIPRSLSKEDKIEIIKASNKARLKEGDIEFVEKPLTASPNDTLERVIKQVESTGYSIIPIVDEFRKLYGVYIHNPDNPPSTPRNTEIKNLMIPLLLNKFENKQGIPYLVRNNFRDLSKEEIKEVLKEQERRFIPILDERGILLQIAFMSKFDTNFLGLALSSRREVWKEEIEEYGEFIDSFCIDSSNAFFKDAFYII
ncbi:MAG: IMP dehydrogenase, partial [Candidatus Pacearchaeota archaeon]